MEGSQYRVLYAMGSRMSHSGPAAVVFGYRCERGTARCGLASRQVQREHLRVAASFASAFLDEIVTMLSDRIPTFSPS
jgi:hypothetical protein